MYLITDKDAVFKQICGPYLPYLRCQSERVNVKDEQSERKQSKR